MITVRVGRDQGRFIAEIEGSTTRYLGDTIGEAVERAALAAVFAAEEGSRKGRAAVTACRQIVEYRTTLSGLGGEAAAAAHAIHKAADALGHTTACDYVISNGVCDCTEPCDG